MVSRIDDDIRYRPESNEQERVLERKRVIESATYLISDARTIFKGWRFGWK